MSQCRTCNESINAPVYKDGDNWFCSLKCWKLKRKVAEMQNRDDRPTP